VQNEGNEHGQAINDALDLKLTADPGVVVYGEDAGWKAGFSE
jgi:pyruvate/2-oxoglutarate/acetoin dehydrogenase E1 component